MKSRQRSFYQLHARWMVAVVVVVVKIVLMSS